MSKHLNTPQRQAVETTEGRVLILAGAGSGKTSVLIQRIAHLITALNVPPSAIIGLTFTNKAAQEMRERIAEVIPPLLAKKLFLGTFHSFCMQVLRKEIHHLGYTKQFSLYDEKDIKRLVTQLARHLLAHEGELPSLESTLSKISYMKSRGLSYEEASSEDPKWKDSLTKDLFEGLHVSLRAYNALDFDSLLSLTVQLFETFPDVLNQYQERCRYLMIDEYQDTNPVQYRLAKLLSGKYNNLCVVGDDDQSIYGWRGAEIKNILQFESSITIKLEQNYRSTPNILEAANSVIRNNKERHHKELWTAQERGEPIHLFHAPTEVEEAQGVVQRIIAFKQTNQLNWSDIAILYRSNILSRTFEMALMEAVWKKNDSWVRGIPYQIFGGTELYERSEIKDLAAYLKTILNPLDQESLLRIINVPRRGISETTLDILTQANRSLGIPLWHLVKDPSYVKEQLPEKAVSSLASFVSLIETARKSFENPPLHKALEQFLDTINYKKVISEDVKSDKMRDFKWENIRCYIDALARYESETPAEEASLHHFVTTTLLDDPIAKREKEKKEDKVNLMTFHSAKGLEFPACFLVCLEDHLLPHEKSLHERGLEEERRLLYVALTRAKKYLTLSMSRSRKRHGKESNSNPSRFLFEIPQNLLKVVSWKEPHL